MNMQRIQPQEIKMPETFPVPASAILKVLADSVRSADTEEKRNRLADTLEQIAKAYQPMIIAKL